MLAIEGFEANGRPSVLRPSGGQVYQIGVRVEQGPLFVERQFEGDGPAFLEVGDDLFANAKVDLPVMRAA